MVGAFACPCHDVLSVAVSSLMWDRPPKVMNPAMRLGRAAPLCDRADGHGYLVAIMSCHRCHATDPYLRPSANDITSLPRSLPPSIHLSFFFDTSGEGAGWGSRREDGGAKERSYLVKAILVAIIVTTISPAPQAPTCGKACLHLPLPMSCCGHVGIALICVSQLEDLVSQRSGRSRVQHELLASDGPPARCKFPSLISKGPTNGTMYVGIDRGSRSNAVGHASPPW